MTVLGCHSFGGVGRCHPELVANAEFGIEEDGADTIVLVAEACALLD